VKLLERYSVLKEKIMSSISKAMPLWKTSCFAVLPLESNECSLIIVVFPLTVILKDQVFK